MHETPRARGQDSFVVHTRQARAAIGSISTAESPRASIVGPAGAGKSTLLRLMCAALENERRTVVILAPGTDVAAVPAADVLVVDDLHLCEPHALEPIRARAGVLDAGLIVAGRPWPRVDRTAEILRLLDRGTVPVVLGQVARSDVLAHLDEAGRSLAPACLAHILRSTGGLTWLVTHALAAHDERDCHDDPSHRELDLALEAQVVHRLTTLNAPLGRALVQICREDPDLPAPWSHLDSYRDLVESGYSLGLLWRDGTTAPLVRSAVAAAPHTLRGIDHSPALLPGDNVVRRAVAFWSAGDLDGAAATIQSLPPDAALTDPESPTDVTAAIWASRGLMSTASDLYRARPPHEGGESAARATMAHLGAGEEPDPLPVDGGALHRPDEPARHSTTGIALTLLDRGLRASLLGRPDPTMLTDLVRASELYSAGGSGDPLPELPAVIASTVALGWGHLTTAEHQLTAAVVEGQGGDWARRRLLLWQAWLAMSGERPADARAALESASDLPGPISQRDEFLLQSVRVGLARRYDTKAALESAWAEARDRVRHTEIDLYSILPLTSLVTAAARLGDATTLASHLEAALRLVGRLGSPPVWSVHLWWAGVQRGILLDRPDMVAPHGRALVAAAPTHELAAVMSNAGDVWMRVLRGSIDPDAVEDAARALASAGLAWDGARLAGQGSRRSDDRKAAGRLLAAARELHPRERSGRGDAPAGRPPAATASKATAGILSQREVDIAVLVLQGRTYNEIGQTIFVSPKTVEHHVAHIRRRLGATSRSDLMARLRILIDEPSNPDAPARRTGVGDASPLRADPRCLFTWQSPNVTTESSHRQES